MGVGCRATTAASSPSAGRDSFRVVVVVIVVDVVVVIIVVEVDVIPGVTSVDGTTDGVVVEGEEEEVEEGDVGRSIFPIGRRARPSVAKNVVVVFIVVVVVVVSEVDGGIKDGDGTAAVSTETFCRPNISKYLRRYSAGI